MTKEEIQLEIDYNRLLIDRTLHTDMLLSTKYRIIREASKKNEKLIEELNK